MFGSLLLFLYLFQLGIKMVRIFKTARKSCGKKPEQVVKADVGGQVEVSFEKHSV